MKWERRKRKTEKKKKRCEVTEGGCVMMNNEYRGRSRKGQSKKKKYKQRAKGRKEKVNGGGAWRLGSWIN